MALAVIKSTDGDSIDSYAPQIFEKWGIGNADEDNGVLVLYALNDGQRNVRIEVGYGLEGAITDAQTQAILQKYKGDLKSEDNVKINSGLQHVFNSVTTLIDKEYGYKVTKNKEAVPAEDDSSNWMSVVIFILIVIFSLIFRNRGGASIALFKTISTNSFVPTKQVQLKIAELRMLTITELKQIKNMPAGTVDVLNGGLTMMNEIIDYAKPTEITTIKASVREGYLIEKIKTA